MPLPRDPHALVPDDLARALTVDPSRGLSAGEVLARRTEHGANVLEVTEPISPFRVLVRQLGDLMIQILIAAGAIALAAWWLDGAHGPPGDALVIGAIVVFNVLLGAAQELKAERAIRELERMAAVKARVVRDGLTGEVERGELVPGDVVLLAEGDRVPADLALVEAVRLGVDESMLTGESTVVSKCVGAVAADAPVDARKGMAFAGTTVTQGAARGLVVATGKHTQMGGIAHSLATTEGEATPLEKRLEHLGRQIGIGVLGIAVAIAANLVALEGVRSMAALVHILMFAVALAVAAVPEGLPTVLTISLAIGAQRLARQRAVVRRMAAVETLGAVTVIVTDKTGTLTKNEMTVRELFTDGADHRVIGTGYARAGGGIEGPAAAALLELAAATGVIAGDGDVEETPAGPRAVGDPTDAALVVLAAKAGVDARALRLASPRLESVPFASERRRATGVAQWCGERWLFVKGSLETLEPMLASAAATGDGGARTTRPFDISTRDAWRAAEQRMAERGLRALALAARPLADGEGIADERGLTAVALAGLGDPLREAVPGAVAACRRAGIAVVMLTGDHPATAAAIAREAGLDPARVHARASPQQKLALVESLLKAGEVVAMTGDGVNDAPALKKVHVGVAMGRGGTAVAVEASDLVLLDDDFAALVTAIESGRGVFVNVQKFIAFLFSGNCGVVLAIFLGTLFARVYSIREGGELMLPLTAAQILWMNLVTDGAPAVAFALARPAAGTMDLPPRNPTSPILSASLWAYVLITGVAIAALFLVVLDALHSGGVFTIAARGAGYARSAGLFTLVTARLWNALNYNVLPASLFSRDGWRHLAVPVAAFISWLMTLGVMNVPRLAVLMNLEPLSVEHVVALTAYAALVLVPGHLFRKLARLA